MSTTSHEGLTAVASSMLALSTVSIALRFYSRRVQKAPLKTDDWIMIPCLVRNCSFISEASLAGLQELGNLITLLLD